MRPPADRALTKEVFGPASKLTDIKPDELAGRGERSIQCLEIK
jgi:hypothetical protein